MERPPRSKNPRQNWDRTAQDIANNVDLLDKKRSLLRNYLDGKQLDAGVCVIKVVDASYAAGEEGLRYTEIWHKAVEEGHVKQTVRDAMAKMRTEGIISNFGSTLYTTRRKVKRKNKKSSVKAIRGGVGSMLGMWKSTWESYATKHNHFSQLAIEFKRELKERREHAKTGNIPQQES